MAYHSKQASLGLDQECQLDFGGNRLKSYEERNCYQPKVLGTTTITTTTAYILLPFCLCLNKSKSPAAHFRKHEAVSMKLCNVEYLIDLLVDCFLSTIWTSFCSSSAEWPKSISLIDLAKWELATLCSEPKTAGKTHHFGIE